MSNYGTKPLELIARDLNKSISSIYNLYSREDVDLKKSYWTKDELDILLKEYSSISIEILRKKLFRSEDEIEMKARSLNLKKDSTPWKEVELELLREMKLAGESYEFISNEFNRTKDSVQIQLTALGFGSSTKRWTEDELLTIEVMSKGYQYTYNDIAQRVNSSIDQVRSLCRYRNWNKEIKRSSSIGEEQILNILQKLNVGDIWTQYNIGSGLRLDFYLPDYSLAIEFDGVQHTEYVEFFHKTEAAFEYRQELDRQKELICAGKNIQILRVSYTEQDIETIIIEAIKNIKVKNVLSSKEAKSSWQSAKKLEANQRAKEFRKQQYQRMKELKLEYKRSSTYASNSSEEEA